MQSVSTEVDGNGDDCCRYFAEYCRDSAPVNSCPLQDIIEALCVKDWYLHLSTLVCSWFYMRRRLDLKRLYSFICRLLREDGMRFWLTDNHPIDFMIASLYIMAALRQEGQSRSRCYFWGQSGNHQLGLGRLILSSRLIQKLPRAVGLHFVCLGLLDIYV